MMWKRMRQANFDIRTFSKEKRWSNRLSGMFEFGRLHTRRDVLCLLSFILKTYILFGQIFVEFFTQFADIFGTIAVTSRIGAIVLLSVGLMEILVLLRCCCCGCWCCRCGSHFHGTVFQELIIVVTIVASTSPCIVAFAQTCVFIIVTIVIAYIVTRIIFAIIVVILSKYPISIGLDDFCFWIVWIFVCLFWFR